ncbi:MAG TPA: ATP-binding protein [Longimicrobium sp.]|nr:ATP-binding protein [Longimicrobium sp.]
MARNQAAELERIRARLEEAERSSEEKTRFIRHVSHEFRTPLSSIIGFAALLQREGEALDPAVRAEYLEIVLRNARHLLHVVNDLLNISKVEAGKLEVTLAPVRVPDVVAAVLTALRPQAEEREIRLRLEDGGAPPALADSGRLRQVLFNLLENAIKYSPPGAEVVVRSRGAGGWARVEVEDRGPGISRRDQGRLFKEFSRVNPPGSRVVGAGLGLALSRMMTEAMRGHIGVESAPGRGSTFWVTLPAAGSPVAAGPAPVRAVPPRRRTETVAVVDDDPDIRAFATAVLRRGGYRAVADDGHPGLGARLAHSAPFLVLLDMHLGGRSGRDALAELREQPALAAIPVLTFTAAGQDDPVGEGFAGRVSKPVEPDALLAQVDAVLESFAGVPDPEPEDDDDFLAPLRARFRAGLADRMRAIESAVAAGDREALRRELHKLRGAAGGYGFDALADAAGDAEVAVREGGGAAELERATALLRSVAEGE